MTEPSNPLDYETLLNNLRADSEYSELPDIDIAMWPDDVAFQDDLSNTEKYNDVFIEVSNDESIRAGFILYFFFFAHNFSLGMLFYGLFLGKGIIFVFLMFPAMAWVFFVVFLFGVTQGGVRFNRRAQLVHVGRGGQPAATLAWRDVKPFLFSSVLGHDLELYFPIPQEDRKEFNEEQLRKLYRRGKPYLVSGHMDWRDTGLYGSLSRLEFYRRYMEQGLEAVQPDPDKVGQDTIRPPSQATQSLPEHGFMLHWVMRPLTTLGIWLAGGPILDWLLRRQARKFQWPEEVERLCAADADLSGLDTRPVKPRRNLFYRPGGPSGIELVNARGQRVG